MLQPGFLWAPLQQCQSCGEEGLRDEGLWALLGAGWAWGCAVP